MAGKSIPVTWFEIPVRDLGRARAFYEQVLEIEMQVHDFGQLKMAWFPPQDGHGRANGSLVQAPTYEPSHAGSMVYFHVLDIDATLERVAAAGGSVINRRFSIGEFGFVGHFEDSEGNRVALHSA